MDYINKVEKIKKAELSETPKKLRIVIIDQETEDVLYDNETIALCASILEGDAKWEKGGLEVSGITQRLFFGHILNSFFCFDQLKQQLAEQTGDIFDACVKCGGIKGDPQTLAELKKHFHKKSQ